MLQTFENRNRKFFFLKKGGEGGDLEKYFFALIPANMNFTKEVIVPIISPHKILMKMIFRFFSKNSYITQKFYNKRRNSRKEDFVR